MRQNQAVLDDAAADEMLLDDSLEDGRIALPVPGALRIHDRDRTAFADPEAIGLRPQDPAPLGQTELLQPCLQVFPGCDAAILVAAFRLGLLAAEKNVPARHGHADGFRDPLFVRNDYTPNSSGFQVKPSSLGGESVLLGSEDNVAVISMWLGTSAPLPPPKGTLYGAGCTRR